MSLSQARRKLLVRLKRRKSREREGLFLVEGIRGGAEAIASNADVVFAVLAPRALALSGGDELSGRLRDAGVEVHEVSDAELEEFSDTESPQGVLLICRAPALSLENLGARGGAERAKGESRRRLLLLDGVQDPGNAGTLVRAAAAFALDGVVALDGTVDLYNPKVVRASAGGHFRVPLVHASWEQTAPWLDAGGLRVVVADSGGEDVAGWQRPPAWALVVGSEGAGVRPAVVAVAAASVCVPMPGGSESLNAAVAGSILLYMMTRESAVG